MREDDSNWFAGWDKELPSPNDLANSSADHGSGDEPERIRRRPRVIWTQQLHGRFVEAVKHLGIDRAVPRRIMEFMDVDGLARVDVAKHLQKYRLILKKIGQDIH